MQKKSTFFPPVLPEIYRFSFQLSRFNGVFTLTETKAET